MKLLRSAWPGGVTAGRAAFAAPQPWTRGLIRSSAVVRTSDVQMGAIGRQGAGEAEKFQLAVDRRCFACPAGRSGTTFMGLGPPPEIGSSPRHRHSPAACGGMPQAGCPPPENRCAASNRCWQCWCSPPG